MPTKTNLRAVQERGKFSELFDKEFYYSSMEPYGEIDALEEYLEELEDEWEELKKIEEEKDEKILIEMVLNETQELKERWLTQKELVQAVYKCRELPQSFISGRMEAQAETTGTEQKVEWKQEQYGRAAAGQADKSN
ncbi:unnamed protein product [Blepharisma stoltei]|uniref:Uncharacterized protein n=1 Tax=Blepharisma stoltei TaxID=1481888 RepID=A0AAU9J944_9CILI|nr:unnamed protein product [Blepharisma stoltei]